jgi:hypothetical protein
LRTEAVRNRYYRAAMTTKEQPPMQRAAASLDWGKQAIEQLEWHWRGHLRPKLDGLTDEEYRWEPVPGMWSIRPRAEAVSSHAAGGGDLVADIAFPEPEPAPLTTIAWRMAHLSVGVFGIRASAHFGDGSMTYQGTVWPGTAKAALAFLDEQYAAWMTGIRGLDAEGMAKPCGPAEGPWASAPFAALILHINREALHHGAEVLLLRDLYRTSGAGRNWVTA